MVTTHSILQYSSTHMGVASISVFSLLSCSTRASVPGLALSFYPNCLYPMSRRALLPLPLPGPCLNHACTLPLCTASTQCDPCTLCLSWTASTTPPLNVAQRCWGHASIPGHRLQPAPTHAHRHRHTPTASTHRHWPPLNMSKMLLHRGSWATPSVAHIPRHSRHSGLDSVPQPTSSGVRLNLSIGLGIAPHSSSSHTATE
jgi:hypothetical protein